MGYYHAFVYYAAVDGLVVDLIYPPGGGLALLSLDVIADVLVSLTIGLLL